MVEKILAYLNGDLSKRELGHWDGDALVALLESEQDVPREDDLIDVLAYLGAGDTPGFPLSWSVLTEFLERFGVKVKVVTEAA